MKTANEFKELRDKKYNDWINFDKKVKGQWSLLETIVNKGFSSLGHSQKYIDISNVGDLYKENEIKLISEPNYFKITKDKNGTRLYFDEKDYNDYVNGNKKVNEVIKVCNKRYNKALNDLNNNVNFDKKSNLKKDTDEQVKKDKKLEANKNNTDDNFKLKFSSFDGKDNYEDDIIDCEDFIKYLEAIPEFLKF